MLRAVVFDFDGLILDTETNEFNAFREVFEEHGHELTLERWSGCVGTDLSVYNPYDHLEEACGRVLDRELIRSTQKAKFLKRMESESVRVGVEAYLQEAKELGLRIALASSSSRAWVTGYLTAHGLLDYFETIHTKDDVAKVKPDPELYRRAVESLGVEPHEAVAFEDSPNGALAAHRAGLHCVIVPNAVTGTLSFGAHNVRLSSMADRSLRSLVEELNASCQA
ncbi:HAD family hydrolase [Paenibacillus koleovorans]|uniref:HAD family hydrolase n=1 Tax=Paenibacillus koleovorans TaxID=121608 RepID=UPI000FDAC1C6|nr:HAD family hydrolase [Paenibacillus koleovorans]